LERCWPRASLRLRDVNHVELLPSGKALVVRRASEFRTAVRRDPDRAARPEAYF